MEEGESMLKSWIRQGAAYAVVFGLTSSVTSLACAQSSPTGTERLNVQMQNATAQAAGRPAPPPDPNTNCTLIVPEDPLSAAGLATPYHLTATDPAMGPCNES